MACITIGAMILPIGMEAALQHLDPLDEHAVDVARRLPQHRLQRPHRRQLVPAL